MEVTCIRGDPIMDACEKFEETSRRPVLVKIFLLFEYFSVFLVATTCHVVTTEKEGSRISSMLSKDTLPEWRGVLTRVQLTTESMILAWRLI